MSRHEGRQRRQDRRARHLGWEVDPQTPAKRHPVIRKHRMKVIYFSKKIAGTGMENSSVFRQLHLARRPMQQPDTQIVFKLPNRGRCSSFLDAEAIGCVGKAAHFRDPYENEDGFEILHFVPSILFSL
jgi:hypothetical protein